MRLHAHKMHANKMIHHGADARMQPVVGRAFTFHPGKNTSRQGNEVTVLTLLCHPLPLPYYFLVHFFPIFVFLHLSISFLFFFVLQAFKTLDNGSVGSLDQNQLAMLLSYIPNLEKNDIKFILVRRKSLLAEKEMLLHGLFRMQWVTCRAAYHRACAHRTYRRRAFTSAT